MGMGIPRTTYRYSYSSCPSGYSTNSDPAKPCVKTETTYSCRVGPNYYKVDGSGCTYKNYQACPSGSSLSGSYTCIYPQVPYSYPAPQFANCKKNCYYCYSGDTLKGTTCNGKDPIVIIPRPFIDATEPKNIPGAPITTYANLEYSTSSGYNPCPSGYETSGAQCRQIIGYGCPAGYTDNGSNCKKPI